MSGPAVDGVRAAMDGIRAVMGRPRAGHARPLQGGDFCRGGVLNALLGIEQVPFGLLGGRGRTCPARLWMVCGRRWEGRGPGMPGPYRAAIFVAGRRPQRPTEGSRPLPTVPLFKGLYWVIGRLRGCGRPWEGPSKPLRPCFARPAPLKGAPFCAGFARGKASSFRTDSPDTGEVARSARRGAVAKR